MGGLSRVVGRRQEQVHARGRYIQHEHFLFFDNCDWITNKGNWMTSDKGPNTGEGRCDINKLM